MKKLKSIFSLGLMFILLMSMNVTASAESSITYNGQENGFDFQPGSDYTDTDLFDNFKDVMPGDVLTETITFTNSAADSDFVNLYMKAVAHDEESNPLTYSEETENTDGKDEQNVDGERDETVATMSDFLSQLTLTVYNGDELIYEGTPDSTGSLTDFKLLGTFRSGETTTLTAELSVPAELGNEYANRVGEVDWVFHVEAYSESQLTVRKVWSDGNSNHEAESVKVNLLKDGEAAETIELNAENNWAYTFDKLVEGYEWTAEEAKESIPEGYTVKYSTEGNVTTITNEKNETPVNPDSKNPVNITVNKVWSNDDSNSRPSSVSVTLYNGGTAYATVELNASNNWSYTWEKLDGNGNWQILETNIPNGYTPSYSVNGTTITVTNTKSLIQTGQNNLPIIICGGLGIILVILGVIVFSKKKRNKA